MATSFPLFQTVGGAIDQATAVFVTDTVVRLIQTIHPWAVAGLTIYVMLLAYSIGAAKRRGLLLETLKRGGMVIIISVLALNAGNYMNWVVDTLQGFQASMTNAVTGQTGLTLWQSLDGVLDRGMALFGYCVQRALDAGWTEFGTMIEWYVAGALIVAAFGLVVLVGGVLIVIATGLLKVALAFGPFFLLMLMFPVTAHLFEKWFSKVITLVFQIMTAAAMMMVAIKVFDATLVSINLTSTSDQNTLRVALWLIGVGAVLSAVTREATRMAGEFGGGLAVEMATASGLISAAVSPPRTIAKTVNPTSSRHDPATGRSVTASRLEHARSGRITANPVYKRAVMEHMNRNWKQPPRPTINRIGPPASKNQTIAKRNP